MQFAGPTFTQNSVYSVPTQANKTLEAREHEVGSKTLTSRITAWLRRWIRKLLVTNSFWPLIDRKVIESIKYNLACYYIYILQKFIHYLPIILHVRHPSDCCLGWPVRINSVRSFDWAKFDKATIFLPMMQVVGVAFHTVAEYVVTHQTFLDEVSARWILLVQH